MQASFNPYREWLDVADGQPPGNFYALFGLEPFENDATAIAVAVGRQVVLARSCGESCVRRSVATVAAAIAAPVSSSVGRTA